MLPSPIARVRAATSRERTYSLEILKPQQQVMSHDLGNFALAQRWRRLSL